jgi:GTP-binding protein Era
MNPTTTDPSDAAQSRCGLVAIVGKPNVGKSTLLNFLVGQKLSITSRKPQTTRHRLLGIKTTGNLQMIFVDTPGLHSGQQKAINRYMNRTVHSVIQDVDLILFMVDRMKWSAEDDLVVQQLKRCDTPVFLLLNKVDLIDDKSILLPYINELKELHPFKEIFPLSALKEHNIEDLEAAIARYLPEGDFYYPEDQFTDRNARFLAAEFIREKITRQIGDELPYEVAVEIEEFRQDGNVIHISALILVEKTGQKRIVIGEGGSRLKLIGTEARKDIENLLGSKVMLNLWVKVKSGWSDDERALKSLGYED